MPDRHRNVGIIYQTPVSATTSGVALLQSLIEDLI